MKLGESVLIKGVIEKIKSPNKNIKLIAQSKIDNKTKPPGSLGMLENLAVQTSIIQEKLNPEIKNKNILVFAGDHGIVGEGVSAFPAEVTPQMVHNFLNGGAAINVLCAQYGIELKIVDMGVNYDFGEHDLLVNKKVGKGTKNFVREDAMTAKEAIQAIEGGIEVFFDINKENGCDILGLGEMGIGNTTSASAIISAVTGVPVEKVTGRGTGVDNRGLEDKIKVLKKALEFHDLKEEDGFNILCKVGGFELAGICGAVLAAASTGKCCIVLDGLISTAAGLIAYLICPGIQEYLVSGHKSVEIGHSTALDFMNLKPVVDLNFRLGEGTGAAIAINMVETACRIMREMASFEDAGVSNKDD